MEQVHIPSPRSWTFRQCTDKKGITHLHHSPETSKLDAERRHSCGTGFRGIFDVPIILT